MKKIVLLFVVFILNNAAIAAQGDTVEITIDEIDIYCPLLNGVLDTTFTPEGWEKEVVILNIIASGKIQRIEIFSKEYKRRPQKFDYMVVYIEGQEFILDRNWLKEAGFKYTIKLLDRMIKGISP